MEGNEHKVNKGFSSIYHEYEELSKGPNKTVWQREMVYRHVEKNAIGFSSMLEINAGSGIDACYFASLGIKVLATDLSDGAEQFFQKKILAEKVEGNLSFRKLSYSELGELKPQKFEYIFSNFGGLNCVESASSVIESLSSLLCPFGKLTVVIMPKHYPREWISFFRNRKKAFRRYKTGPISANVEGEQISVWYHSLSQLKKDLENSYSFVKAESLGAILPQNDEFGIKYPILFKFVLLINGLLRTILPAGIGDYYVATFQKKN